MSTPINHNDLQSSFEDLFKPRSEEKEIKHDSLMLMAAFLSEIEVIQDQQNISRTELAKKIKTSPSYLTQVFRSKKPLNFITLAKIKRVLKLRFEVKAYPLNVKYKELIAPIYTSIPLEEYAKQAFINAKNDSKIPIKEAKFNINYEPINAYHVG